MADFDSLVSDGEVQSPPSGGPVSFSQAIAPSSAADHMPASLSFDDLTDDSDKYSTTSQHLKTAAEGAAEGVLGPLAPAIEKEVLHVKPQDILARQKANPVTHGVGQVLGLGASLFTGVGEGAIASKLGAAATEASTLGKGASIGAKIGAEAIDQAVQMAVLQGGDEASKMILNDPEATAQNAIANVGLASALGGVTGAAFGAVSPLWKASGVPSTIGKGIEDMKARWAFRKENPDLVQAAHKELQELHTNISDIKSNLFSEGETGGGIRGDSIAKAMPEVTPQNTQKISESIQKLSDDLSNRITKMSENVKTSSGAKLLEQDLKDFQTKVTNPDAGYTDQFNAIDDLKRTLQGYSKYGGTAEQSEFGKVAKNLAAEIRPTLEDAKIWGDAANVQKDINSAISKFIPAEKDMMSKFTTKLAGEQTIDPGKINTYMNQVGKPNAEIKQAMVKNYLEHSEKLVDAVNKVFTDRGLEPVIKHTSTNVLNDSIGKKTAGAAMMDSLIDKAIDKLAGKGVAGAVGGAAGSMFGHPGIGIIAGEHALGPMFSSAMSGLTKSIIENQTVSHAFKSALDFTVAAAKGQKNLTKAVNNVLIPGQSVLLSASMQPSEVSRTKLDKQVTELGTNPTKFAQMQQGQLGHYLPNHQTALTQTQAQALQYLQTIKPQPHILGPLDKPVPPQPAEVARYNRALDIAQHPAVVLDHIKSGTLLPSDIADISHMYPALYKQMSQQLSNAVINHKSDEMHVPYKVRMGISLFLGQPLDASMQPQSIMAAQPQPKSPQQEQAQGKTRRGTTTLGKSNNMYRTATQNAERDRSARD